MKNNNADARRLNRLLVPIGITSLLFAALAKAQPEAPPDNGTSQPDRQQILADTRRQYDIAIEGELYDEAAEAGKSYVSALLQDPGHDRQERVDALSRLAFAQKQSGNISAAIENYQLAVDIAERNTDRLNLSLAEPLLGLSRTQTQAGEFRDAVVSYDRYLHLQQVNRGPHAFEQADAVNELSEIYYMMGDHQRANALQQAHVSIYNQTYPDDYLRQLPARFAHADMMVKTGRLIDSQAAYRRIMVNIERAAGTNSLELLPAIYRIADLFQNYRIKDGKDGSQVANRYLRKAVYLANNHEDATPVDIADAHIALGDYISIQTVNRPKAFRQYLAAWQALSADPSLVDELEARFGQPTLLNAYPRRSTPAMHKLMMMREYAPDDMSAKLSVQYDVGTDGRPRDVRVVEGDPTGYWDGIVSRHVEDFVFRPGILAGEPVGFDDQVFEIHYSYTDQEYPREIRHNAVKNNVIYRQ